MVTFRRPPRRYGQPIASRVVDKPSEGSILYNIINSKPTVFFEFKKAPIYKTERYLKMLKKNNEEMGLPYEEPNLPPVTPYQPPEKTNEPDIVYADTVHVTLRILKSGIVRIKLNTEIATLHEKYYSHAKFPPIKEVIRVYKSHGFSEEFIEKIKKNYEKKIVYSKKVAGILEKIFDKAAVKKVKKVKKKKPEPEPEEEIIIEDPPEEEEEEDIIPEEEGQMDVEPDEEDVPDEEEYISEPET